MGAYVYITIVYKLCPSFIFNKKGMPSSVAKGFLKTLSQSNPSVNKKALLFYKLKSVPVGFFSFIKKLNEAYLYLPFLQIVYYFKNK